MKLINGKQTAESYYTKINELVTNEHLDLTLAMIRVGEDEASKIYMKNKSIAAKKCGIKIKEFIYPESISQDQLLKEIDSLNKDNNITGILVQLPLPEHLDKDVVLNQVDPSKDVDCLTSTNLSNILLDKQTILPCTPNGIVELLTFIYDSLEGLDITIIGRSNLVGKPLAAYLINRGSTVTVCNSNTKDLSKYTSHSDVVVIATGQAEYFNYHNLNLKNDTTIIDVGINRKNNSICGDFDISSLPASYNGYVTPVPGGVGPMTVMSLMSNVIELHYLSKT